MGAEEEKSEEEEEEGRGGRMNSLFISTVCGGLLQTDEWCTRVSGERFRFVFSNPLLVVVVAAAAGCVCLYLLVCLSTCCCPSNFLVPVRVIPIFQSHN